MQVGAGAVAGAAGIPKRLALVDVLPDGDDRPASEVAVSRAKSAAVVNIYLISVTAARVSPGKRDGAGSGGNNRLPTGALADVYPERVARSEVT